MAFGKKHTKDQANDEYYVVPVIPVDEAIHTPENPFCDDMSCPCHEDGNAINDLNGYYQDGLISSGDADRIYRGKTLGLGKEQAMATRTTLKLPTSLLLGKGTIRLEQDETATLVFINGITAGILTYEVYGKKARLYDTDLILMIVARRNTRHLSPFFNAGFIIGNVSTLAQKSVYIPTDLSFSEGYQEGRQAYTLLSKRHVFTTSELCSLLSWQHQDQNSAFNAGYITGFIQGLTHGRNTLRGSK